jgi:hypothetical protein
MLEAAFEYQFHGQPEIIPTSHDGWHDGLGPPQAIPTSHDGWLSPGQGHLDMSGMSGPGHPSSTHPSTATSLASNQTLVGTPGGFQIDLLWDPSVANAPSGFKTAVVDAATNLANLFTNDEVINMHIGWGEVGGTRISSNSLGESESYGYLSDYATVAGALHAPAAANDPTTSQFFVTSAEAKTLGLVSATSGSVDGYVGFGTLSHTGYSWDYNTSTSPLGAKQFDFQAVVQHELSEVMGRIGMGGQTVNHAPTYTPLDLFNFKSANTLELSANGGYFSNDGGLANLGTFNNASLYGGDVADWASATSPTQSGTQGLTTTGKHYDAFDAFAWPGYVGQLTTSDISELVALGYQPTA